MLNDDGEPLLMGSDVAKRLGYKNPAKALRDHVDDEDKLIERIVLSGQRREVILINESGLYSLILSFSRICNPAASNIRIFNPYTARVSRAFRRICRSNGTCSLPGKKNVGASLRSHRKSSLCHRAA